MAQHRQDKIIDITEESQEERVALWLRDNGRQLLIALGLFLAALLIAYIWHVSSKGRAESDYLAAENAFQQLEKISPEESQPSGNPAYVTLKNILDRHPELGSRYNGPLAQMFLRLGEQKLAIVYADKALKELTTENLPFYEEFSKTSLLIAEAKTQEAIQRAIFLQKRMQENMHLPDPGFRPDLLIINQIRIGSLLHKLGNPTEELQAWKELQSLTQQYALSEILETIQFGQVSFKDYVQERQKALQI